MKTKTELTKLILRKALPYGAYLINKDEKVFHNRDYEPIWRVKAGKLEKVNPKEWIKFKTQEHYFDDSCPPWRCVKTLRMCHKILQEIGAI